LLLFSSDYLFLGISQYADILLGYLLLSCLVSLVITLKEKDSGFGLLSGVFLGLSCFAKNEGIALSFILVILAFFYLYKTGGLGSIVSVATGLCLTLPWTIIFKFLTPANRDISVSSTQASAYFNLEGFVIVLKAF